MLGKYNVGPTLAVSDMETATAFYGGKLGLRVEDEDEYEIIYGSGDSKVHVYVSQFAGSNKATAASWEVEDVAGEVAALREQGIEFEHYADMPGTRLEGDVHTREDNGEQAVWFKDPFGNILCLHNHGSGSK